MKNHPRVRVHDFSDLEEVAIMIEGDQHIGAREFDEERLKRHLNWAVERADTYVINIGDMIEGATRDSVGAGVYEQTEVIEEQLDHAVELHQELVDEGKLLGVHRGNHEERTYKAVGLHPTAVFNRITGVPDLGYGVLHYVKVGDQNYTFYTTHGSGGARLPHTKIKKCIDLEKMIEAEIYAMGHLHSLSHHARQYYAFDKRGKTLVERERHFVITGAYLKHWGSYAHMSNMEPGKLGSAVVHLQGDEHNIRVKV